MVSLQTVPSAGQKVLTSKLGGLRRKGSFYPNGTKDTDIPAYTQLFSNSLKRNPLCPKILGK